ncbi:DUF2754 family protein [Shigella flexneri]
MLSTPQTVVTSARMLFLNRSCHESACKNPHDWHYYAFAIGLIFILNG